MLSTTFSQASSLRRSSPCNSSAASGHPSWWRSTSIPNGPFRASLDAQEENTRREFQDRTDRIIVQLMEQLSS
ncbi:hypothetical protein Naga_102963g1 [Nannochloropsis gaditana]|uniref:Uncharacterized protein n=1 Tax=Nannochloropsis gaditana TaxID=72520 RepID=W7TP26_9STRA|nr:hypothetical protein Naga_102963g1 [Nannochloropsis gaditana]